MRFKVDENLPIEVADLLRAAGHDAATLNDQGVGGAKDPDLAALVQRENRVLAWISTEGSVPNIGRSKGTQMVKRSVRPLHHGTVTV